MLQLFQKHIILSNGIEKPIFDTITAQRGQAISVVADIVDLDKAQQAVHQVHDAFGRVDILVNSAGSIRVLSVAPTFIKTPGTEAMSNASAMEEQMVNRIPLGRAGVPDDIARAVLFCACDLSLFMTGSTLYLDGGQMAMV